jgi:hypothetical protein
MSVGNGDFVFSADVTGLQTLFEDHGVYMPLCTMAQWAWHSRPNADGGFYTIDDVVMEKFPFNGREVSYALNVQPGNEEPYKWMRQNPHRLDLARVTFKLDGKEVSRKDIFAVHQELFLYEGRLESAFMLDRAPVSVKSACHPLRDLLAFEIESGLLSSGRLTVEIIFPYGDHHLASARWDCPEKHQTFAADSRARAVRLRRQLDRDVYFVNVNTETESEITVAEARHTVTVKASGTEKLTLLVEFAPKDDFSPAPDASAVFAASASWWERFWETGAAVRLSNSSHPKALELERRIILSQYILAIQSAGSMPPAETGLTCNSWYGKFHLEMHLWHSAWLPLWGHTDLLERSLKWYHDILPTAKWNAERNGFKGARWPKMVAPDGIDCPSFIATLLVWQQPHILYMLELMFNARNQDLDFAREHYDIISATADFMADYPVYNKETGYYDLAPPIIPSIEIYKPLETKNPGFELAYWKFGLKTAIAFAERLGLTPPEQWVAVYEKIAPPPLKDGKYLPHEWFKPFPPFNDGSVNCEPGLIGLLPGEGVDKDIMRDNLRGFLGSKFSEWMIGWSFPFFAMCAARLGLRDESAGLLLKESGCNIYLPNGHNPQGAPVSLPSLPIYLPGNGGLLLGVAVMAAGFKGGGHAPGFPEDGQWVVETDGLMPLPF